MPGSKVRIIGVPMDLGQDRRGVDVGPSAPRVAGLNAHLRALEVVESNPVIDARNKTAQLGVELVLSALGKRIL